MVDRKEIVELRKVAQPLYANPEVIYYSVEFRRKGDGIDEWYDLLEDPPEWLCDFLIEHLIKKTEAAPDFEEMVNNFLKEEYPTRVNKGRIDCIFWNKNCFYKELPNGEGRLIIQLADLITDSPSLIWSTNVYY